MPDVRWRHTAAMGASGMKGVCRHVRHKSIMRAPCMKINRYAYHTSLSGAVKYVDISG